ncbi:hypothetical protein ACFVU2_17680 [Leifsonia sp. NPDC058194]|uniref:hypothetical protein n=1 Tax=Leifsonia sp. NPDC058194 TaxID=3346374 RepID=UPI0036D98E80
MVKHDDDSYVCFACGFDDFREPTRIQFAGGLYQSCHSCGYEEGFTDDHEMFSFAHWRDLWVLGGSPWSGSIRQPDDWDPTRQLATLPVQRWTWAAGDVIEIDMPNGETASATIEWVHPRNYYLRLAGDLVAAYGASAGRVDPRFSVVTTDNFLVRGFWRVVGRAESAFNPRPASPRRITSVQSVEALVEAAAGLRDWYPGLDQLVVEPPRNPLTQ